MCHSDQRELISLKHGWSNHVFFPHLRYFPSLLYNLFLWSLCRWFQQNWSSVDFHFFIFNFFFWWFYLFLPSWMASTFLAWTQMTLGFWFWLSFYPLLVILWTLLFFKAVNMILFSWCCSTCLSPYVSALAAFTVRWEGLHAPSFNSPVPFSIIPMSLYRSSLEIHIL